MTVLIACAQLALVTVLAIAACRWLGADVRHLPMDAPDNYLRRMGTALTTPTAGGHSAFVVIGHGTTVRRGFGSASSESNTARPISPRESTGNGTASNDHGEGSALAVPTGGAA